MGSVERAASRCLSDRSAPRLAPSLPGGDALPQKIAGRDVLTGPATVRRGPPARAAPTLLKAAPRFTARPTTLPRKLVATPRGPTEVSRPTKAVSLAPAEGTAGTGSTATGSTATGSTATGSTATGTVAARSRLPRILSLGGVVTGITVLERLRRCAGARSASEGGRSAGAREVSGAFCGATAVC